MTLRDLRYDLETLDLMHVAWCLWKRIRKCVYHELGVSNTEELIRWVVNVDDCEPNAGKLGKFLDVLRKVVKQYDFSLTVSARDVLKVNIDIVPFFSELYPCELLKYRSLGDVIYPPLVLYVKNSINMNSRPLVAVVGTRECSEWGKKTAFKVGELIARNNWVLVTGLAKGIDASAAKGALTSSGRVIGVRPWLKPLSLPKESRKLLKYTSSRVSIVAETYMKPKTGLGSGVKYLYYLRNRIIAGMSKVVVVVEARDKLHSGSMHQIDLALRRGKTVVILKHPKRGSTYWEAYRRYVSKGALSVSDPEEVVDIINDHL